MHPNDISNFEGVSKAEGFLAIMTQFPFIVTLEMAVELFDQTLALSKRLQKPDQTLGKSMQLVKDTIVEVESKKNKYDKIFKKAKELADELDIPVLMPRGRVGKKGMIKIVQKNSIELRDGNLLLMRWLHN